MHVVFMVIVLRRDISWWLSEHHTRVEKEEGSPKERGVVSSLDSLQIAVTAVVCSLVVTNVLTPVLLTIVSMYPFNFAGSNYFANIQTGFQFVKNSISQISTNGVTAIGSLS